MDHIPDVYEKSSNFGPIVRKQTGLIFDDSMLLHKCQWDPNYPECPERYLSIIQRYFNNIQIAKSIVVTLSFKDLRNLD